MIYLLNAHWVDCWEGGDVVLLSSRDKGTLEGIQAAYEVLIGKVKEEYLVQSQRFCPEDLSLEFHQSFPIWTDEHLKGRWNRDDFMRKYLSRVLPILSNTLVGSIILSSIREDLITAELDRDKKDYRVRFFISEVEEV